MLIGLEEELGLKILVAVQSGMDHDHYRRATGERPDSIGDHTFLWLN